MVFLKIIFPALITVFLGLAASAERPELHSGDLIFQTSLSAQSQVIQKATASPYSHVGIIEVATGGRLYVVEAISQVSRTKLDQWIARGSEGKFAVYRPKNLTPLKAKGLVTAAKTYLGRDYDVYFSGKNDEIYCSELVDYAARDIGLNFGRYQKFGSLHVNNDLVIGLARARWKGHPLCQTARSFEDCWPRILEDEMITPVSLTEDPSLEKIFSTY